MNCGSGAYKSYHFLKDVTRTFRSISVNCFTRLKFLAEVCTKLQKMHFLDNLRTITQEESMETKEMTPFVHLLFSALFVKWPKFTFMWSPLWSILVCKIPQFWAEATDSGSPTYFYRKQTP